MPEDPGAPVYWVELDRGGRKQTLDSQRRGDLVRVWLDDIDDDGAPDVLVHTVDPDPNAYGYLDLFYLENDRYRVRSFPRLAMDQLAGFRGRDVFAVREGRIYRSYPVFRPEDPDDRPTGGSREFVFDFATESWQLVDSPRAEEGS